MEACGHALKTNQNPDFPDTSSTPLHESQAPCSSTGKTDLSWRRSPNPEAPQHVGIVFVLKKETINVVKT